MELATNLLNDLPLAGLMFVVTAGYLLGRIQFRGLALGPAGGTLLVALALGSLGLSLSGLYHSDDPVLTLGGFGFALFIYSVGFEAGPGFLNRRTLSSTWRFVVLGVLVNSAAVLVAIVGALVLRLEPAAAAGLLAGALTSAPTYAAALEVCDDKTLLAVAFAVTYPLGLTSLVLLAQFLPGAMGDDLAAETESDTEHEAARPAGPELRRVFQIERSDVLGRSLEQIELGARTGCVATLLHRGSEFQIPDAQTVLESGDHLMVKGRLEELRACEQLLGPEVYDDEMRRRMPSPRAVQVTARAAAHRSLRELRLVRRFGSVVTEVHRRGIVLEPDPDLRLQRDDVVLVSGRRADVRRAARALGRFERSSNETDISVYAGGILLGLLLGAVPIGFGEHGFRLGSAVGLLTVGLLLGRFRRVGRLSAHVPIAARQLVRDLGILLFVAETGVAAGEGSWSAIRPVLWPTVGLALLTVVLPVVLTVFVGRRLMAMRAVDVWGSVGGGMTSSAALAVVRQSADSNEPAIGYAAAFAVASVLATLAGQLVVYLL